MSTFVINPHGRLQEWVAEEHGYFESCGLTDFELRPHGLITKDAPKLTPDKSIDNRKGAYQTYESGRDATISCACHWTVNMAAAAQHGKLWGESYSISPCAIMVPADSPVKTPAQLAGVAVHVGYQSGSHYATIQSLEQYIESDQINLVFSGSPADRVDQMLDGSAPAATVFGPQLYLLEQMGYRKICDCTFMMTAMVPEQASVEQIEQYYAALKLAQGEIDFNHQRYAHYYMKELPPRHADLVDVTRFGPGERIVFEPYSETIFQNTQSWIIERGIFDSQHQATGNYTESVLRVSA